MYGLPDGACCNYRDEVGCGHQDGIACSPVTQSGDHQLTGACLPPLRTGDRHTGSVIINRELSMFSPPPTSGSTRLPDSMHRCLCIDEIVRLITHELIASRRHATSVALACCCKSFEDPVLDVLWQTQWALVPLLKTLPRDVGMRVNAL